jgi:quercetin dioxygenase-like cupin family protein
MTQNVTVGLPDKPLQFLDSLMAVRADAAQTAGQLGITEFWAAEGHGSPMMVHSREDGGYFVIDGELEFWLGDGSSFKHGPGGFVWMPRGAHYAYGVSSPSARFLCITTPGGLERFFNDVSTPAADSSIPAGRSVSDEQARRAMAAVGDMGITIVGPPPAG